MVDKQAHLLSLVGNKLVCRIGVVVVVDGAVVVALDLSDSSDNTHKLRCLYEALQVDGWALFHSPHKPREMCLSTYKRLAGANQLVLGCYLQYYWFGGDPH